jgi:hypothetical protein
MPKANPTASCAVRQATVLFVCDKDFRQYFAPQETGPFTGLSAEGGHRPGVYAGLGELPSECHYGCRLSAAFTRLLVQARSRNRSRLNAVDNTRWKLMTPPHASIPSVNAGPNTGCAGNARKRASNILAGKGCGGSGLYRFAPGSCPRMTTGPPTWPQRLKRSPMMRCSSDVSRPRAIQPLAVGLSTIGLSMPGNELS